MQNISATWKGVPCINPSGKVQALHPTWQLSLSEAPWGSRPLHIAAARSCDIAQLGLFLGSVCSPKLQFRSVLTLLKLLVIKHVNTGVRATSDPVKGKQNKRNQPKMESKHVLTSRPALQGHGVAAPQPAAVTAWTGGAEEQPCPNATSSCKCRMLPAQQTTNKCC